LRGIHPPLGKNKSPDLRKAEKYPETLVRRKSGLLGLPKVCYLFPMPEPYKILPNGSYFVTLSVVGGIDIFTRYEYCDLLVDNLNYCIDHKRLQVYEYAILSNQLIMIAGTEQGNLSKILRDFKSYSAKQILRAIAEQREESRKEWIQRLFRFFADRYQHNSEHHFWQFGNQPIDLDKLTRSGQKTPSVLDYLLNARLVDCPAHYRYCSAYPLQLVKLSPLIIADRAN
jgi:putative transposase